MATKQSAKLGDSFFLKRNCPKSKNVTTKINAYIEYVMLALMCASQVWCPSTANLKTRHSTRILVPGVPWRYVHQRYPKRQLHDSCKDSFKINQHASKRNLRITEKPFQENGRNFCTWTARLVNKFGAHLDDKPIDKMILNKMYPQCFN